MNEKPVYKHASEYEYIYAMKAGKLEIFLLGSTIGHTSGAMYSKEAIYCPYQGEDWSIYYNSAWNRYPVVSFCDDCCPFIVVDRDSDSKLYRKTNTLNKNGICLDKEKFENWTVIYILIM